VTRRRVLILILLLLGGIPAYQGRAAWGYGPGGVVGLLLLVVLVVLVLRLAGVWI
jgi:hypothetical protein